MSAVELIQAQMRTAEIAFDNSGIWMFHRRINGPHGCRNGNSVRSLSPNAGKHSGEDMQSP